MRENKSGEKKYNRICKSTCYSIGSLTLETTTAFSFVFLMNEYISLSKRICWN